MRTVRPSLVSDYTLIKWDPSGETKIWVKQVRQAEDARRSEMLMRTKIQRAPGMADTELVEVPIGELVFLECFLSYEDSTINWEVPIDSTDATKGTRAEPMFPKGLAENEFRKRFGTLDLDLVREWQEVVRRHNPNWGINIGGNS